MAYNEQIGDEQRWAKEACSKMQTDIHGRSLRISHYTSDWDSKACKGIEEGQNDSSVILLRETQHLSVSMHRAVCNAKFLSSMFPKFTA